ncbi:SDR family NAD(P)-dependent oxidoreductase [Streptomyces sp. NBC_01236]|uniref:SDR family NAD(P)-dependent oxidoreductase n=1 Tax=Streptomyces sp. NBC_01236 TaxID=2903789 RepID=UPI002E121567|nr:SDR family NAD(P)-dependent oxidoreductase [Streptomyces sp. NBC_01236]
MTVLPVSGRVAVTARQDQSGRTALITGANAGTGLACAKALAVNGATVLLACRSAERGAAALAEVRSVATADVRMVRLDLADQASVRQAAGIVREVSNDRVDVFLANAGVAVWNDQLHSADGYETVLATNYLGHAALTALLWPSFIAAPAARLVFSSSLSHHLVTSVAPVRVNPRIRQTGMLRTYARTKV